MGQQQLLLLIVCIVVVALGSVMALVMYTENLRSNDADAVLSRTLLMAQAAIEWRARDRVYGGGGGGSYAPLEGDGIELLGLDMDAVRTSVEVTSASGDDIEIIGVSETFPDIGARVAVSRGLVITSNVRLDSTIVIP